MELALAEWRLWPGEYTPEEGAALSLAWLRRKRLEAQLVANAVGRLLGGRSPADERIDPDRMWAEIEAMGGGTAG